MAELPKEKQDNCRYVSWKSIEVNTILKRTTDHENQLKNIWISLYTRQKSRLTRREK